MVNVLYSKKNEFIPDPYFSIGNSGFDLRAEADLTVYTNTVTLVNTGLFFEIPMGYELQIRPRSGLAFKHGITVLNAPGTVDSNYRGEVKVILYNVKERPFEILAGDRIAQGVICPVPSVNLIETDKLQVSERGSNGFGSSGVK